MFLQPLPRAGPAIFRRAYKILEVDDLHVELQYQSMLTKSNTRNVQGRHRDTRNLSTWRISLLFWADVLLPGTWCYSTAGIVLGIAVHAGQINSPFHTCGYIRSPFHTFGQVKISISHIRTGQISIAHVRTDQISVSHIRIGQISIAHIQTDHIPISQIRTDQISIAHIWTDHIPISQIRTDQISIAHIWTDKTYIAHIRTSRISISSSRSSREDCVPDLCHLHDISAVDHGCRVGSV